MKQQIVVITGENVIEEGVIIEQEGDHSQNNQIQRSRKQQIEIINTEEENNGNDKPELGPKKVKVENPVVSTTITTSSTAAPTAAASGRMTRASASKTIVEVVDKTNKEPEDNGENRESNEEEGGPDQEQGDQEEETETNDQKDAQSSQKRTRGRTKSTAPVVAEDDSSPQRKSARIARK